MLKSQKSKYQRNYFHYKNFCKNSNLFYTFSKTSALIFSCIEVEPLMSLVHIYHQKSENSTRPCHHLTLYLLILNQYYNPYATCSYFTSYTVCMYIYVTCSYFALNICQLLLLFISVTCTKKMLLVTILLKININYS